MGRSQIVLLWILSTSLLKISVLAFQVTSITPKAEKVKEGDNLAIKCIVDGWWEWCTFRHAGQKCDFEWTNEVYNVTVLDCQDFKGRFEFDGNYNQYECGLILRNVRKEDAGEWTCELENYYSGRYRGYGYNATANMVLEVKQETTTTTTTTSTSSPTLPNEAIGLNYSWTTNFVTRIDPNYEDMELEDEKYAQHENSAPSRDLSLRRLLAAVILRILSFDKLT